MKKQCAFLSVLFIVSSLAAQALKPLTTKTIIVENEDVEAYILCHDTAGLDQSDWLKLIIKNKSAQPIYITDANQQINGVDTSSNGSTTIQYGKYGEANKYHLFDMYFDSTDASSNQVGLKILSGEMLSTWKYMTDYASVLIHSDNTLRKICPQFKFSLRYTLQGKSKQIADNGTDFCFFWKPNTAIPKERLAQRLLDAMQDIHLRNIHTYIISHLMANKDAVSLISSENLINAILNRRKQRQGSTDEIILFLAELKSRNAFPDSRLTEIYANDLKNPTLDYSAELMEYWDNSLMDSLLNSSMSLWGMGRTLEAHANVWSLSIENKAKVYECLSRKLPFNPDEKPTQANFKNWSYAVKIMSISRDKRIVNYLVPLLDNEAVFEEEDWSRYKDWGMIPKNPKPDTLKTRVCDIAFISLLRAVGQTNYETHAGIGTQYPQLVFKPDFLDHPLYRNMMDVELNLTEKAIKLTPNSRERLKNYIKSLN